MGLARRRGHVRVFNHDRRNCNDDCGYTVRKRNVLAERVLFVTHKCPEHGREVGVNEASFTQHPPERSKQEIVRGDPETSAWFVWARAYGGRNEQSCEP